MGRDGGGEDNDNDPDGDRYDASMVFEEDQAVGKGLRFDM